VVIPIHLPWVEEWDYLFCERIDRFGPSGLMEIALGTSQGEVFCCVGSALADWDVMLDMEAAVGEALWGSAKLAAALGSIDDLILQFFGNFGSWHSLRSSYRTSGL
jgi:hypothetical protein